MQRNADISHMTYIIFKGGHKSKPRKEIFLHVKQVVLSQTTALGLLGHRPWAILYRNAHQKLRYYYYCFLAAILEYGPWANGFLWP